MRKQINKYESQIFIDSDREGEASAVCPKLSDHHHSWIPSYQEKNQLLSKLSPKAVSKPLEQKRSPRFFMKYFLMRVALEPLKKEKNEWRIFCGVSNPKKAEYDEGQQLADCLANSHIHP